MKDARPAGPFSPWEWTLAIRYLRGRKKETGVALISAIAFAAIALAIAVLIIVMSVMNGFRAELLKTILSFNDHAFVHGAPLSMSQYPEAVERLKKVPGVIQVQPQVEALGMVAANGSYQGVQIRGIRGSDLQTSEFIAKNIKDGSLRGFGEGEYGGDFIVIGERLAQALNVHAGDAVTLFSPNASQTAFGTAPGQKQFTVGAVYAVGMSTFDQIFGYIPLEQAQAFFGRGGDVDSIKILVKDADHVDEYLPGIKAAAGPGAIVTDWRDADSSYWGALKVERNMMRLIMMLIILIAALNIISALVMLVKNKERDIAILRTIGAGQGAVMRIFLLSGAAIGVTAAPIGVLLGVLFCVYIKPIQHFIEFVTSTEVFSPDVYFLTSMPAKLDWAEVVMVFAWTLGCSLVVTLYPSWRASRIDPVEALRYE